MKSEAQAYQAIRKYWKILRNSAQRQASLYDWEAEHQEAHPRIQQAANALTGMDVVVMPILRPENARLEARRCKGKVSLYQCLLNGYKVKP